MFDAASVTVEDERRAGESSGEHGAAEPVIAVVVGAVEHAAMAGMDTVREGGVK